MEQLKLEPVNLRDLGGIQAAGQKHIATQRLIRCGELTGLGQEVAQRLKERYDLKNIVDFRTKQEREASPDSVVLGTEYIVLDFFPAENSNGPAGSGKQMAAMQDARQVEGYMKELYASFITSPEAICALRGFVQILLQTKEGATIFHCFAGKDRTGIAAAVTLSILGVSKDAIMEDYLQTNVMRQEENEKILAGLKAQGQTASFLEALGKALCVEEQYLEESFKTAKEKFGSFENYISEGIGIREKEQRQLREMYLV